MTNEVSSEETRRDRWVRLPYALMLMMALIGALSYFLDSRVSGMPTSNPGAQAKTEEFIKRRIAEHELAAKQPAPVAKPTVGQKSAQQLPAKLAQPARSDYTSSIIGAFNRINFRSKLAYLKTKPRWIVGASLIAFLSLAIVVRRRRRKDTLSLTELLLEKETPAFSKVEPEVVEQSNTEAVPCIFSLYANEETVEEGSFIATYIKPTISSFVDSLRSIVKRQKEERDPMHTLIPAVMRSISSSPSMAAPELNSTGNLFRRAVLIRK